MERNEVKFKDMFGWRTEQLTFIEFGLGMFAFALIGFGLGTIIGSETGRTETYYVWIGWGISIVPPLLILLRLGIFK